MTGGTISGNTVSTGGSYSGAHAYGGGVCIDSSGTFTMNGGTISGNTASVTGTNNSRGGGVYVFSGGTFRIANGTIYGSNETTTTLRNTVTNSGAGTGSYNAAMESAGTAQRGTLNGETWTSSGTLSNSSNTIRVVNGVLQ
jgi:hypothetical protein